MKRTYYLLPLLLLLVGQGCLPDREPPKMELEISDEMDGSILDEVVSDDVNVDEAALNEPEMSYEELLEQPFTLINEERVRVPAFRTDTLEYILYPDAAGYAVPAGEEKNLVICANDYLVGTFFTLDGKWIMSTEGDCAPTGTYVSIVITGQQAFSWRTHYAEGPPEGSIMDELESD